MPLTLLVDNGSLVPAATLALRGLAEKLAARIRQPVEPVSLLHSSGVPAEKLGGTPAEAYFVRCDRSTMSQSDLDNGRMVCLIGVAPTKPAEFVIFRIGQWTADASIV